MSELTVNALRDSFKVISEWKMSSLNVCVELTDMAVCCIRKHHGNPQERDNWKSAIKLIILKVEDFNGYCISIFMFLRV